MAFLRKCKTKNGIVWRIYYRIGNTQKTKTIGKVDKKTAQKCFQEFSNDLAKNDFNLKEFKNIDLISFIKLYSDIARTEKSIGTVKREMFVLNHFKKFIGDIYINQIDIKSVIEYRKHRLNFVTKSTVNIEMRHLKAVFNAAVKLGHLKTNPFTQVKMLKIPESRFMQFFEVEDIEIIRQAFKDDDFKYLIKFYILTGARLREPLSLTWNDVDMKREHITIRSVNTKAKRNRVIQFRDDFKLKKLLSDLPQRSDGLLFGPLNDGKQWSPYWVGEKIRMVLKDLGYPWASSKTFRHSYISHLAMSGVPLTTVQELVGHATYITTLKYSHLAPSHKTKMIKKRPY